MTCEDIFDLSFVWQCFVLYESHDTVSSQNDSEHDELSFGHHLSFWQKSIALPLFDCVLMN